MREKEVEEVKVKLENMSAEEVNELMGTIELLIDSEEIQQLKDKIGNKLNLITKFFVYYLVCFSI